MRLRFTLIFAAKISHHSIDNNVKIFTQTQTHIVNGALGISLAHSHSLGVSRPLLSVLPVSVLRVVFDSVDVFVTFLTSGYWASKRLVVCRFTFLSLLYHTAK